MKVEPLMSYFKDVLNTFLGFEHGSYIVRELSDFIKNILVLQRWAKV